MLYSLRVLRVQQPKVSELKISEIWQLSIWFECFRDVRKSIKGFKANHRI